MFPLEKKNVRKKVKSIMLSMYEKRDITQCWMSREINNMRKRESKKGNSPFKARRSSHATFNIKSNVLTFIESHFLLIALNFYFRRPLLVSFNLFFTFSTILNLKCPEKLQTRWSKQFFLSSSQNRLFAKRILRYIFTKNKI